MKVCHMTSAHDPEDIRIFHKECVSLAKNGYDVYLVERGDSYEKNGVHIVGVGTIPDSRLRRMTQGAKRVYETALALDCDIYHFHDPELLPYGLMLKKKGKKVIFDSHENTVEQIMEKEWIPNVIRKPSYMLFHWYQKHVCRQLDAVISVTPHICDYFRTVNSRTCMITNYPNLQPLEPQSERIPGILCFAGGISKQWNHDKIIRAIEEIDGCSYILCGSNDEGYLEELKKLPGWEKVDYRGRLPHEEISGILKSCQIGLSVLSYSHNTSFHTGTMGNTKIFEEMMAGLPVICTDFDLWREFVERYECGICVNPGSIQEISDAIRYLIKHPEEAIRMGSNGRRAAEQEFNWGIEEQKLLQLYNELMD